ncbi:TolC family protein [Nostoc ellipsosporum NOK]|nr:TolC family protein [Nostoc ellipsosporum NOK]
MRTVFSKACLGFLFLLPSAAGAQNELLQQYIDSAFAKNIVLEQKNISLEKANAALEIAKSWSYPAVNFQFGYQTADGGRDIYLPLGDLLNGVYATLNQLTASNAFPQLENQRINFLPKNFYDGRVRTTMPIINEDIRYGKKISRQQITLSEIEIDLYKRELVKNIKTAYYQYLTAQQAVAIYESALELAREGQRVNQKLLDNGKGLHAYLLRSNSEIEQVNAQLFQARQQVINARAYFNLLLNRDQNAPVESNYDATASLDSIQASLMTAPSSQGREEFRALSQALAINENVLEMNKRFYYPKLNGFLDLGSQSQNWQFNGQSRYYMIGVQLDVPIFAGFRNKYKIRQAELDARSSRLNIEQTRQQLQLTGSTAHNNLVASWQSFQATTKQLEAASAYQRLIERGYREGTSSFIETIDARNQFTQAQLQYNINQYRVLIAAAALERETASFNLKK